MKSLDIIMSFSQRSQRTRGLQRLALSSLCLTFLVGLLGAQGVEDGGAANSVLAGGINQPVTLEMPAELKEFIELLLKESLPKVYEDEDGWGDTKEVFNGWDFDTANGKLKTKRKWKSVPQGTWKKYRLELVDPDDQLEIEIYPATRNPDSSIQWGILVIARIQSVIQIQEWQRGIRLWSTTWEGESSLKMAWSGRLTTDLDVEHFPPDLILKPQVELVQLELDDFDLVRVSQADGPAVKSLGEAFEGVFRDIVRDQGKKIVEKANNWIAKHPEKSRVSVHDAIRDTWKEMLSESPPEVPAK
jgi:hypothetical protein